VGTWRRHSRGNYSAAADAADASRCNYRRRCNNNRISLGPAARPLAGRNVESGKINAQLSCSGADSECRHKQIQRDGQMNDETATQKQQRQQQQQVANSATFHSNATHHELCASGRRRMTETIKQRPSTSAACLIIAQFIGPNTRKSAISILPPSPLSLPHCVSLPPPASTLNRRCCNDIHNSKFDIINIALTILLHVVIWRPVICSGWSPCMEQAPTTTSSR